MRALVTGGGGFIGGGIARSLVAAGHEVRSFSRGEHAELRESGIESVRGDLADRDAVLAAAAGCTIVFHVAALAGVWGPRKSYERTNVLGTDHVIEACRTHGISRLVFTSSPSVTFDGRDQRGIDETAPYPARFLADYPRTKAIAERRIRAAADETLATVSLRPHLVWGPGDPHFLPRLVERARRGKLRLVGSGESRVDTTYIDNAVEAHILAGARLEPGGPISGKAYFISNEEPLPIGVILGRLLDAAGLPPAIRRVPAPLAATVGALLEGVYRVLGARREPAITQFVARQLSTDHWFDITAARRDFEYQPRVSIDEGIERLRCSLAKAPATSREGVR